MSFKPASPELDWEQFQVRPEDLEFLSSHLLEVETPLSPAELAVQLVAERLRRETEAEATRQAAQKVYLPKERYSEGQRNVAEALLDMVGGGPLPTTKLLGEVELPSGVNPKLAEFSLDLALQEDQRFDEVGPAGKVAWFLRRLEPEAVRETPLFLRYQPIEHERNLLSDDMLELEQRLDDELSPPELQKDEDSKEIQIPLIFPHWRVGSLPLTRRVSRL